MKLFDTLRGLTSGAAQGKESLVGIVTDLIVHHSSGSGLAGLVQEFEERGLGPIVQSWIGTGPNQPISGEQIQQGLGSGIMQQLAGRTGMKPEQLSALLAQFLPKIVDHLTPNGQIPDKSEQQGKISGLLQNPENLREPE